MTAPRAASAAIAQKACSANDNYFHMRIRRDRIIVRRRRRASPLSALYYTCSEAVVLYRKTIRLIYGKAGR